MSSLIGRKVARAIAVLVIVSLAVTVLIDLTPGDPALAVLSDQATDEQIAEVHRDLNLDDPLISRYSNWLVSVAQGDFGTSFRSKESVGSLIGERLPVTLELLVLSLLLALVVSIPIAVYTAYRADGRFDRIWQVVTSTLISTPPFVSALLLVFVFSLSLRHTSFHFPVTGWVRLTESIPRNLWHAVLPALTLALSEIPAYTRVLRADMITTLREEYILAAKGRGLSPMRILLRHALRPSSFSLITLVALSMGRLVGATVIVETIFALPGLGALVVSAVLSKDFPVVQGVVMFVAIGYVLINALTDLAYTYLDPRVRLTKV